MKIENTTAAPLMVFHIPADGERTEQMLQPAESVEITLQPGDNVITRVATELTDAPEA